METIAIKVDAEIAKAYQKITPIYSPGIIKSHE